MSDDSKIGKTHLQRAAVVYIRQSSAAQSTTANPPPVSTHLPTGPTAQFAPRGLGGRPSSSI
jgi:hypothetical protein